MTYEVVRKLPDIGWHTLHPTDIVAWAGVAGFEVTGYNHNSHNRIELQGHPIIKGFAGPMWGGMKDGQPVIRYEDWAAYERLSA